MSSNEAIAFNVYGYHKRGKFAEFGRGFLLLNEFSGLEDCKGKLQKGRRLF